MSEDQINALREREPFCWIPTATARWLEEYDGPACATQTAVHNRPIKSDGGVPLYADPPPLTDLEAENAKLRQIISESIEFMRKLPDEIRLVIAAKDAEIERLRESLAEVLKALEPFALVAEHDISEDETDNDTFRPMPKPFNHAPQITVGHLRAARRVLEGGNVDG